MIKAIYFLHLVTLMLENSFILFLDKYAFPKVDMFAIHSFYKREFELAQKKERSLCNWSLIFVFSFSKVKRFASIQETCHVFLEQKSKLLRKWVKIQAKLNFWLFIFIFKLIFYLWGKIKKILHLIFDFVYFLIFHKGNFFF